MNQGSGKPPPATARRRAMEEDAPLWRAPEWMQPGARETQEPHAQSYPQSVSAKQALSAALLTKLTAEQQKAFWDAVNDGGVKFAQEIIDKCVAVATSTQHPHIARSCADLSRLQVAGKEPPSRGLTGHVARARGALRLTHRPKGFSEVWEGGRLDRVRVEIGSSSEARARRRSRTITKTERVAITMAAPKRTHKSAGEPA